MKQVTKLMLSEGLEKWYLANRRPRYEQHDVTLHLFKDMLLQIPKLINYLLKNSAYLQANLAFKQQQKKKKNHLTGTTNSDLKI